MRIFARAPSFGAVKWSTRTHFVEGSANPPNNSRIVNIARDGSVPVMRVEPLGDPDHDVWCETVAHASGVALRLA